MTNITLCRTSDLPALQEFLHHNWAPNHILARSMDLMAFQHGSATPDGSYNWLIAKDNNEILGILGFIPTTKYDQSLTEQMTWLALWKVRSDRPNTGLGLKLLSHLMRMVGDDPIGVLGINPNHPPIYRALRFDVDELKQYFVTNHSLSQGLIQSSPGRSLPTPKPGNAEFKLLTLDTLHETVLDPVADFRHAPLKTPLYLANRYLHHPIYLYHLYQINLDGKTKGILVTRVARYQEHKALRIVDFVGDPSIFSSLGTAVQAALEFHQCEYADLWQYGLNESHLSMSGFELVPSDNSVIVPSYFEPFAAKNVRIQFAVKNVAKDILLIFRGDGDQDRPNVPPGQKIELPPKD